MSLAPDTNGMPTSDRKLRALSQPMDVVADDPATWNDAQVAVYHRGERRLVDPETRTCDCPDSQHRAPDGGCKHVLRARYALGLDPLPVWVTAETLDAPLRNHTDTHPTND